MNAHLRQRAAYYDQYSTVWITPKGKKSTSVCEQKRKAMLNCQEANGSQLRSCIPESTSNQVESHTNSLPTISVSCGHPRPGGKTPHFSAGTASDVTDTGLFYSCTYKRATILCIFRPSSAEGTSVEERRRRYGWMGKALAHMCVVGTRAFSFLGGCRCASIHSV